MASPLRRGTDRFTSRAASVKMPPMHTENEDSPEALRLARGKTERLEHAVRVYRVALGVCVALLLGVLLVNAFGQRRHFARAIVVDNEICCLVATQKDAETVRQRIVAAAKGKLPGEACIEQKWEDETWAVEERPVLSVAEAVEVLKDKVSVKVEAAAISVNGVNIATLASEDLAQKVLDTLKSEYIGDAAATVVSQKLTPEPSISTSGERPEDISTDIREVVAQLTQTRRQPEVYVVKTGDFPEKIAGAHNMRVAELYKANPGLKGRTIHPGEKLKVGVTVPAITVVTVLEVTSEETIEPPVSKQHSPALKRGERRVSSAGKPGRRKVTYRIKKHNDKQVTKEVLEEQIIEKPQPKRVLIGTGDAG